jgi:hypothetical protein
MSSEALLSNIVSFAGSGLLGYALPGPRPDHNDNRMLKKTDTAVAVIIGMTYFVVAYIISH